MDIVTMGELLIDFTDAGTGPSGMRLFEQNPGGAPANVACCAAALGRRAAFIGKVGRDMHGDFLRNVLDGRGVDTSGLVQTEAAFTTLAFVQIGADGERSFSFARKPGADTTLRPDELNLPLLRRARILSVGSLSMTDEPARSATLEAVRIARTAGAYIAYDPNYRASLWRDEAEAVAQMRTLLPMADMVKLAEEETALLTGSDDPAEAALRLAAQGIRLTAITLGADGALVCVDGALGRVPGFTCRAVDTTGAGDAFWGGFLCAFLSAGKPLDALTLRDAEGYARFANATAACCVQKRGAIPAMPGRAEVEALLRG